MAAIAQSDRYAIFMRKIGYSVGLEYMYERVSDLVKVYVENRDISINVWNGLRNRSTYRKRDPRSFEDFFFSLRLIQRTAGDILVLENLDALAIGDGLLNSASEQEQDIARLVIILQAILINDGEIFVNLLLAGFEEEKIKSSLTKMILRKRKKIGDILQGRESQKRIGRIITIERQESNRGSTGGGQSVNSLRRTEPLQVQRFGASRASDDDSIVFSDDYFRKVPPRRKEWARSLGLWDDETGLTHRGRDFVDGLSVAGFIDEEEVFTYWPMDYELLRAGFRPNLLGEDTRGLWDCLVKFGAAYSGPRVNPAGKGDTEAVVKFIKSMMEIYKSLHVRKAMLRRELPITVAYPVAIAYACAKGEPVYDIPAAIRAEQRGAERRLAFRQSRNTGGALSVRI